MSVSKKVAEIQQEVEKLKSSLNEADQIGLDRLIKDLKNGKNDLKGWTELLDVTKDTVDEVANSLSYVANSFRDSIQELSKQNSALSESKSIISKIARKASEVASIRKGEQSIDEKSIESAKAKINEQERILKSNLSNIQSQLTSNDLSDKQKDKLRAQANEIDFVIKNLDEYKKGLQGVLDTNKKTNKELGFAAQAVGGIDKAMQKLGLPPLGIASALEETKKLGQEAARSGKKFNALGTFIGKIGKNLAKSLTPINVLTAAMTVLVSVGKKVDKQTGDFAKSMNLSYNEALGVRKELTEIGRTSASITTFGFFGQDPALNTRALAETLGSINKSLGTTGKLSEGDLKTFTKLREQAGMSNEEIMGMQKFSMVMGGSLEKNTVNFQAQAKALSMSKGTAVNVKSLMADMGKVSSRTKLSIEGGAEGLATAAVNAKLMGGNLDQVASIADSLLNFESSISNELEAELLLGKDINLEKARTAALNNDMATVAAEITKQAGTAAEFGAMNRIQQEGLAKAMGMSADQMGDMLFEQEALKSIGQSLNEEEQKAFDTAKKKYGVEEASRMLKSKAQGEGLEGLLDQQSAQEEFNMAIEKAKEVFVTIAQDILPAIKLAMTPILFIIQAISEGIQVFIKGLKDGNPLAVALAGIMAGMAIPLLISAVGAIMSTFAMIPLGIGIPLGIAAVAGMYSMATKAKSVKDGVIDPKGGIMMSGEKGSIQLDKDDSVVAGTNLFGGKKGGSSQPTQGGGDMSTVINAINALASRPINVSIDGDKIITATTDQKPNETGGAIRKNSYQVQ
tara:strand:- start:51 stop:2444 length:2394 start_codon:yes stop_codon:yes gene_type:complete